MKYFLWVPLLISTIALGQLWSTKKRKEATEASIIPSGVVQAYFGASAPDGWLIADGSCVSKTTYADLFNVIGGLAFNTGCGASDFKLPPLQGRYLRGAGAPTDGNGGDTLTLGNFGADKTAVNSLANSSSSVSGTTNIAHGHADTFSVASGGAHTHLAYNTGVTLNGASGSARYTATADVQTASAGSHSHTLNGSVTNLGTTNVALASGSAAAQALSGDTETRPHSYAVNYIIKI